MSSCMGSVKGGPAGCTCASRAAETDSCSSCVTTRRLSTRFRCRPRTCPPDIDTRQVGGLGVHFVRTFMDRWSYARVGEENIVALGKDLGKAVSGGGS